MPLYGFSMEGRRFSNSSFSLYEKYYKRFLNYLSGKVHIVEVPVYVFLNKYFEVDENRLKSFMDEASRHTLRFTAHAGDNLQIVMRNASRTEALRKLIVRQLRIAERIGSLKIVFHQNDSSGRPLVRPEETSVKVTLENVFLKPQTVQEIAHFYGFGFTLDVAHAFVYAAPHRDKSVVYSWLRRLHPTHLHLTNTYFRHDGSECSRGLREDSFTRLGAGTDMHYPLEFGDIDYKRVFSILKIPRTIIIEAKTESYMQAYGFMRWMKGYERDLITLSNLLKRCLER